MGIGGWLWMVNDKTAPVTWDTQMVATGVGSLCWYCVYRNPTCVLHIGLCLRRKPYAQLIKHHVKNSIGKWRYSSAVLDLSS
jgi:hypothetical protein